MASQLVYVDGAGELRIRDVEGGDDRGLAGAWMMEEPGVSERGVRFRWPTWSPLGDRIAFEGLAVGPEGTRRSVLWRATADGLRADAVEELPAGGLVYLQWSADGSALLTLTSDGAGLLRLARSGEGVLLEGAPLFFSSVPGGAVATHVFAGNAERGRVVLLDGGAEPEILAPAPGSFRAPCVLSDGSLLFTARADGGAHLVRWSRARGEERLAGLPDGRAALLSAPDGAVMVATGPADAPEFGRLQRLDLESGTLETVLDRAFSAAFPLPQGGLAFVTAESSGAFAWRIREPHGPDRELIRFVPTEEESLRLGFFDQYARSHSPVAPDGAALVVAGVDVRAERLPPEPCVYVVPFDPDAVPVSLGAGRFGVFPAGSPPR